MHHIEQDECRIISVQDFQMQRAERQITKDVWEAEVEPFGINPSIWDKRTPINTIARTDLLDNHHAYESGGSATNPSRDPGKDPFKENYPPLTQAQVSKSVTVKSAAQPSVLGAKTSSNLIDLNEPAKSMSSLHISQPTWGFQQPHSQGQPHGDDPRIKGWLKTVNEAAQPPSDNESFVASMYDEKQQTSKVSSSVPASTRAVPNQTAPHQHIIQMPAHSVISSTAQLDIEKYFDPIRQVYACPTIKCKRQYKTKREFQDHLLTSSHIGGQVTCPSCLKRFPTTYAWVAHSESASKKCDIRNSANYNQVMREITGGVLGTQGFNDNGSVRFVAPMIEDWSSEVP